MYTQNSFVKAARILSGFLLRHNCLHLLQNGILISACCFGHAIGQACTFFPPDLFVQDRPRRFLSWCLDQQGEHPLQQQEQEPAPSAEEISKQQRAEMQRNPSTLPATPNTRAASTHATSHAKKCTQIRTKKYF